MYTVVLSQQLCNLHLLTNKEKIQMDWKFEGSKQRINSSRTEYSIFLKEMACPIKSATEK